jgi:hypothetical protein
VPGGCNGRPLRSGALWAKQRRHRAAPGRTALGIYDVGSDKLVRKVPVGWSGPIGEYFSAAAYGLRFGRRMPVAHADGTIYVVDLVSGEEVARLSAGNFSPKRLAISSRPTTASSPPARLVLEVKDGKAENFTPIQVGDAGDGAKQRWRLVRVPAEQKEKAPAEMELVRRLPVSAASGLFYATAVSKGGKYALVTYDVATGCGNCSSCAWLTAPRRASRT